MVMPALPPLIAVDGPVEPAPAHRLVTHYLALGIERQELP